MKFRQAILRYNGTQQLLLPDQSNSFDELYADFRQEAVHGGQHWSVFLHPKQDIVLQGLELQFDLSVPAGTRFFANGYQSWSESRLLHLDERMPSLLALAKPYLGYAGDEHISNIPRGRGKFHSWTYTYLKKPGSTLLAGSLSERTGFTLFLFDRATNILTVRKDLENLSLAHSFPALDFWLGESTEQDVFAGWFAGMDLPKRTREAALGWTSWYQHFTNISETVIAQNLDSLSNSGLKFKYFQVDDGWQTSVGDWFSIKPTFPKGMATLSADIKSKGLSPGLWIAPFVAAGKSELVRRNPDWLLKNAKGQPVKAGWNPQWGGWFYALDFYHTGVRDYLSGVFHTALDKWGFELLKLDFLYAVCLVPPVGKTRGAVMWEAMEFLRNLVGERKILACGAPLGTSFGLVDYCRIGGDIHLKWEHRMLARLGHRERVSSIASLRSTLGRWQLNGSGFLNDPDVFILRSNKQSLTANQQHSILTINVLLGSLLFTSDNLVDYSPEQMSELSAALEWQGSDIRSVQELQSDVFRIDFEQEKTRMFALCNLTKRACTIEGAIELQAFETIVLKHK